MNNSIFAVELSLSEFFVHKYGGDNEIKFNSKIEIFLLVTLFLSVSSQSVLNNALGCVYFNSSYHCDHIHRHKCFIILTFNTHKIEFQCYNH